MYFKILVHIAENNVTFDIYHIQALNPSKRK